MIPDPLFPPGGTKRGKATWIKGKPFYDPANFTMEIEPGLNDVAKAGVEAHEETHIGQFLYKPGKVWYAQSWLPGNSIAMYQLGAEAYRVQARVIEEAYHAYMPFLSHNMLNAGLKDFGWLILTMGGGAVLYSKNKEHKP